MVEGWPSFLGDGPKIARKAGPDVRLTGSLPIALLFHCKHSLQALSFLIIDQNWLVYLEQHSLAQ